MAHILVVDDDDAQIRESLGEYIKKMGHSVAMVTDGIKALEYIDAHVVDLMVLDIVMPEQDGIGTILKVMNLPKRPAIIAISGGSRSIDIDFIQDIVKKLPIAEFLRKPFRLNEMGDAIERRLLVSA